MGDWADDNTVVATFQCDDCTNTITPEVTVTPAVTSPTCTEAGFTVYTAKVTNNGTEYTNPVTKTVEGDPATGHTYGEPTWSWAAEYGSATATFACACGDEQTETDNHPEPVEVSAATCTADQVIKYTAKVTFRDVEYTTETDSITVPDTAGHTLVNHSAKAPTCTEIGWNAYQTCANCAYTTYEEIPANGHAWTEPTWEWEDVTKATATFNCPVCGETRSIVAEGAAIQSKVTLEPTTKAIGHERYTATVTLDGRTYTASRVKDLPALPQEPETLECPYCGQTHTGVNAGWVYFGHFILFLFNRIKAAFHR